MIHLTEKAAKKPRGPRAKGGAPAETGGLRVGVQGGGCSGLSYAMRLETQARDRDKVFEEHGARLFVDPKSYLYLHDTTLEWQEDLMRQGFVFQNPNAARSCGCGRSFSAQAAGQAFRPVPRCFRAPGFFLGGRARPAKLWPLPGVGGPARA